jgi:arginyl-tRNA synthetase
MDYGNVKKAVNVIDVRQDYPQALVRLAFSLMGRDDIANGIKHLSYGALELETGALSGRSGNWIGNTADDLLNEAEKKAFSLINESKAKLSAQEKNDVARAVAIGAIKFDLLRLSPEKKTIFSWARALGFKGNSGPYCQYMYARAVRLIEDSGIHGEISYDPEAITTDYEFNLVKQISRLTEIVEKSCVELRPNVVTEYTNNLASAFSNMYEGVPILKSIDERQKQGRLALALAFANIIKYSLSILGIPSVNRM